MSKPLHKRIDTPGPDAPDEASAPHKEAARRHLSDLRDYLKTIEARIDEVETLLSGETPGTLAERESKHTPSTVGAGRLLEALSNAQRSAGQIYALCAAVERAPDAT